MLGPVVHSPCVVRRLRDELTMARTETKHFIYFYIGSLAILIWKS